MLSLYLGTAAFVLFLLYDINSFLWQKKFPRTFFLAGILFLSAATALDLANAWSFGSFNGLTDFCLLTGSFISFAALIYCLFFALPFKKTYADQQNGRRVYDRGVYALCRHPGILCFFAMYLLLGLAALPGNMLFNCILFSMLNLAYACFQDLITFPRTFCDYTDYKKNVPFLIPTDASVRTALQTLLPQKGEEENS